MSYKIQRVEVYILDAPLTRPFAYSQAWFERRDALLVEVVAEDETGGWGDCFGPMTRAMAGTVDFLKPALIGQDAMATEALWQATQGPGLGVEIDRDAVRSYCIG
jgi:D-galactarolactone cycloisomerase